MESERVTAPSATTIGRCVLLVDDDRDFVDGISRVLERRAYQVVSASSTAEAREAARRYDAHVALLDIRLGQESGISLIRDLEEIRPNIICVMSTAYADLENSIQVSGGAQTLPARGACKPSHW